MKYCTWIMHHDWGLDLTKSVGFLRCTLPGDLDCTEKALREPTVGVTGAEQTGKGAWQTSSDEEWFLFDNTTTVSAKDTERPCEWVRGGVRTRRIARTRRRLCAPLRSVFAWVCASKILMEMMVLLIVCVGRRVCLCLCCSLCLVRREWFNGAVRRRL